MLCVLGLALLVYCADEGPSRVQYNAKANETCARYNGQIAQLGQPTGSIEQQADHSRRINQITLEEIRTLRAIPAPKSDRNYLSSLFNRAEEAIKLGNESAAAIERRDLAAANAAAQRAATMLIEVNHELESFGANECAR